MAEVPTKKKGFLGGNIFPKLILIFAVAVIISAVIFGLPTSVPDFVWFIIRILIGIGLFIFGIMVIQKVVIPSKQFSPTESWKSKLIPAAEMSKPPRTRRLYLRGENMHLTYFYGKISGLLFIPNWAGVPIVDKSTGKLVYIHKHDKLGKPMYDSEGKPVMTNSLMNIHERDGDWLFVIQKGLLPALSKKILVRANVKLCSDIMEDVYIKSVNLVPVGEFFFPHQQWQSDIIRINMQALAETVQECFMQYLDLCAFTTESSLRSDSTFAKLMHMNTEAISSKEAMPIQQLGRQG